MTVTGVVALTGATGFIGSHLLTHLLDQGVHIKILVRQPQQYTWPQHQRLEIIAGDMHDTDTITQLVADANLIVHCAGRVKASRAHHFHRDNVLASELIFKLAQRSGALKKFVYISSLSARHAQLSHYAASKYAAEQSLIGSGIDDWTIIRPPAVYGPKDTELKPLFDWMQRGILWIPAEAENRFSLLHVQDLCNLISHTLASEDSGQVIIEPDDGMLDGYNWWQVQAICSEYFQRKITPIKVPARLLKSVAQINLLSGRILRQSPMLTPSKVQELLHDNWVVDYNHSWPHWRPMIDLKNGLHTLYSRRG